MPARRRRRRRQTVERRGRNIETKRSRIDITRWYLRTSQTKDQIKTYNDSKGAGGGGEGGAEYLRFRETQLEGLERARGASLDCGARARARLYDEEEARGRHATHVGARRRRLTSRAARLIPRLPLARSLARSVFLPFRTDLYIIDPTHRGQCWANVSAELAASAAAETTAPRARDSSEPRPPGDEQLSRNTAEEARSICGTHSTSTHSARARHTNFVIADVSHGECRCMR